MKPEVKVGKPHLTLHQGHTVLVTKLDGGVTGPHDGLYFLDTRLISEWRVMIDGKDWVLLNSGVLSPSASRIYLVNPQFGTPSGTVMDKSLGLSLNRHLDGGMHDDIEIINHGPDSCSFLLEIALAGDFADIFDVKSGRILQRGMIETQWNADGQCLMTRYRNGDFIRAFRVKAACAPPMGLANGRLAFTIVLPPAGQWHCCLLYDFADGSDWTPAPRACAMQYEESGASRALQAWRDEAVKLECSDGAFCAWFNRALEDMAALRLPIQGSHRGEFVPAAGLPWFATLFGRDSLIISLQSTIVHPEFAQAALQVLGHWQAQERDDYRDAEPGKIMHELRRGELAYFRLIPHTPYYGTADATPLYLTTLHAAFMVSGDRDMLADHLAVAEGCLDWIDRYGDRDGDGFQEYQTRSPDGYENQSWKDSGQAIVYPDGSLVKGPKATCEMQAYVYDAWLRMGQLYDYLGRHRSADRLRDKAADLFERFNQAYWDETEGTYVLALDGDKHQVRSVASNPGHCLWAGIVPADRAQRVAARLMEPDMWSGWGIRTLSSRHRSFNPYHYQVGAVWPHDNGLIAQGMARYGFRAHAGHIARAITDAASFFDRHEMPELYAGIERNDGSFPAQYLGANVPQGWAAGAVFSLLQALAGFQPDAPGRRLYLDPALPDWMPSLTIRELKVGGDSFDIRFERDHSGKTDFKVLRGPSSQVSFRPMAEWSDQLRRRMG